MRKKHRAIYDHGYTAAIRDVTNGVLKKGEKVTEARFIEVIKSLMSPIRDEYTDYD